MYAAVLWATDGLTKLGPLEAVIGRVDEVNSYLTLTHSDITQEKKAAVEEKKPVVAEEKKTTAAK